MAALTSSGVTFNRIWYEGDRNSREVQKCVDVTLVLSTQGGATNNIPASILGLSLIYEGGIAVSSAELVFLTGPSYAQTLLQVYNIEVSTDANRADPVDITGTIRVIVRGKAPIYES
jgi:hypothetical protein